MAKFRMEVRLAAHRPCRSKDGIRSLPLSHVLQGLRPPHVYSRRHSARSIDAAVPAHRPGPFRGVSRLSRRGLAFDNEGPNLEARIRSCWAMLS